MSDIDQDTKDALEMMGKGYEHPVTISPPHSIMEGGAGGLKARKRGGWIKLSTSFLEVMQQLKGAKLAVYICLALHINENNECFPAFDTIAARTGYSRREVISSVQELQDIGFLTVTQGVKKSNLYTITAGVARGAETAPVQFTTSGGAVYDTEAGENVLKTAPEVESLSRPISRRASAGKVLQSIPEGSDIAWQLAGGVDPEKLTAQLDKERQAKDRADLWEREMGYNPLPWWSDRRLEKLLRFLLGKTPADIHSFAEWSKKQFSTFPPTKARQYPEQVIELWPLAVPIPSVAEEYDPYAPLIFALQQKEMQDAANSRQ